MTDSPAQSGRTTEEGWVRLAEGDAGRHEQRVWNWRLGAPIDCVSGAEPADVALATLRRMLFGTPMQKPPPFGRGFLA
jgi:hypothetical protein